MPLGPRIREGQPVHIVDPMDDQRIPVSACRDKGDAVMSDADLLACESISAAQKQSRPYLTIHPPRQDRQELPRLHRHNVDPLLASSFVNMTWGQIKPHRATCQTATRPNSGGYSACSFRPPDGAVPCMSRKPLHNARGTKSFRINALCGGGDDGIRTHETVSRLHP